MPVIEIARRCAVSSAIEWSNHPALEVPQHGENRCMYFIFTACILSSKNTCTQLRIHALVLGKLASWDCMYFWVLACFWKRASSIKLQGPLRKFGGSMTWLLLGSDLQKHGRPRCYHLVDTTPSQKKGKEMKGNEEIYSHE